MVPDEIRERREALGLNQREMADLVGVPHGTYANWEKGRSSPRHVLLEKLQRVISDLENGKGTSLTIQLSTEEYRQLTEKAERQGKSIDDVISDMKRVWLSLLIFAAIIGTVFFNGL
jgi:transcriptional regulator with XRE-family HTH domain